ncbi:MAG TPA: Rv3654c family TadE-like protein [Marmoricola sp.]|nr:Rv3654c family TadE-like protein [Marmoricola sp.]
MTRRGVRRRTAAGTEAGVATVLGVAMIALLAVLALAGAAVVGLVDAHRQAQAAADLAALAGGGAVGLGQDPCAAAAEVARRNGARLTQCWPQGATVGVVVTVPGPPVLGRRLVLPARARAGPVTPAGLSPR